MAKEATSYRLSAQTKLRLKALAQHLDDSETHVLELLIKEEIERRGINVQDQYEVRVIRENRGEFIAWSGSDEQLSKEQYDLWKEQNNIEKVGRFVNGNYAEPPYVRTRGDR